MSPPSKCDAHYSLIFTILGNSLSVPVRIIVCRAILHNLLVYRQTIALYIFKTTTFDTHKRFLNELIATLVQEMLQHRTIFRGNEG